MKLETIFLLGGGEMVTLRDFQRQVVRTDRRPPKDKTRTAVLGIFGELGSLMSEFKKRRREGPGYTSFNLNLVEEAGDLLWYFTALGLDLGLDLHRLVGLVWNTDISPNETFRELAGKTALRSSEAVPDQWLLAATRAGEIARAANRESAGDQLRDALVIGMRDAIAAIQASKISLSKAAASNMEKSFTRFPIEERHLPLYDIVHPVTKEKIPIDERLPRLMDFDFEERQIGRKKFVVQKVHTIKIGDPLTDNIGEEDDYRFHDVFHLSYAAILGWSPVLRALLKIKRKSFSDLDENEGGARAILIEEGISTLVFNWAKPEYLHGIKRVDYTLLKNIKEFTRGYEVHNQPFWAWEKAILRGYAVFRELRDAKRGRVTMDLRARDIRFTPVSLI